MSYWSRWPGSGWTSGRCWRISGSTPQRRAPARRTEDRLAGAPALSSVLGSLRELPLDHRQHRLPISVPALVVAHLAQLGRGEVRQAGLDLRGGQLVVAEDRERGADAHRAARAVELALRA